MTEDVSPWPGRIFLLTGVIALLASCVIHSRGSPMWVDELYSFNLIQDPSLPHALTALADRTDGSMPLYFLLIRPWAAVFGLSELSLRLFSAATFCAGFALVWQTLRRAWAFWPAAVSLAVVMGTSHVIRFEEANVRFYGLFFALIALATLLAVRLGERERPRPASLIANACAQAALVLCHPLGGIYSAALLAAGCAGDWLILKRVRPGVAWSYPAGWLALLLWLRPLLFQADLSRPHGWMSRPEFNDLPGVLYGGSDFYPLWLLFAGLAAWRVWTIFRPIAEEENPAPPAPVRLFTPGQCRQLLIAFAFVCFPLALWTEARAFPSNPLFLARYVIGVSIGWAVILTAFCAALLPVLTLHGGRWTRVFLAGFVLLQFGPLLTEPGPDYRGLTGKSDPAFGHDDLPIVCLRSHDFLPRVHYSPQADRYWFLLDWDAATAPKNSRHATVEYKLLDALRRNYADLFHHHIVGTREFLGEHPAFLVHEVPHTSWVSLRLRPEEYIVTRLTPDRALDYALDGVWPMLLVERKNFTTPGAAGD